MLAEIKNNTTQALGYVFSPAAVKDFHGRVIRTFDDLPVDHKLREVATRILIIAVAFVVYPLLIITAFISLPFRICCMRPSKTPSGDGSAVKKKKMKKEEIKTSTTETVKLPEKSSSAPTKIPDASKEISKKPDESLLDKPKAEPSKEVSSLASKPSFSAKIGSMDPTIDKKVSGLFSATFAPKPSTSFTSGEKKASDLFSATFEPKTKTKKEEPKVPSGPAMAHEFLEELPKEHFQECMKLIRLDRQDDYKLELKRLRDSDIFTKEIEAKFDSAFAGVYSSTFSSGDRNLQAKFLFARALEIKRLYGDQFYIFTHAQSTVWMTTTYLIKELVKTYHPETDSTLFKYLRAPEALKIDSEKLKKDIKAGIDDHTLREGLQSVDAYFYSNTSGGESAIYFLLNNASVFTGYNSIIQKIVSEFLPKELAHLIPTIASKMEEINKGLASLVSCGNLFVFCVPKNLIKELGDAVAYRSHPYGKMCSCHPGANHLEILEKLQNDILDDTTKCTSSNPIPQYRLLTEEIKPENGIQSHFLTPFGKAKRKEIKGKVKALVKSIAEMAYSAAQKPSKK